MILGLSTSLEHTNPQQWAQKHKSLGLGAVVFPVSCDESDSKVREYKKAADEAGLVIAEVGVWRNVLSPDSSQRKKNLDYAVRQLAMADEIGAKCAVNIAGTAYGPVWDGGYAGNFSKEAWDDTVKSIRFIIDEVKPGNTKYAIETMPWMVPTGPDEYLRLMEDVSRDEFGIHLDIVNMINCPQRYFFNTEFIDEVFEKLGKGCLSCHIKNVHLRPEYTFQLLECACRDGELNLEEYAKKASQVDPKMPMIIEHLHSDEEYLASLKYLQKRLKKYAIGN